jgi:hypothetical protein
MTWSVFLKVQSCIAPERSRGDGFTRGFGGAEDCYDINTGYAQQLIGLCRSGWVQALSCIASLSQYFDAPREQTLRKSVRNGP